ncbi:MAG: hypothetical protein WC884_04135 [Candidatus Paceibacterota bacterium]
MIEKEKQKNSGCLGMFIIFLLVIVFIVWLTSGGESKPNQPKELQPNDAQVQWENKQNVEPKTNTIQTPVANEDTTNEYGSSLTECLQKADSWFVEEKQAIKKVLAEEKTRNNPYQDFIDQNATSESEIMGYLKEELVDYKKECNNRF